MNHLKLSYETAEAQVNNPVNMITVYNYHIFRPRNILFSWKICIKFYYIFIYPHLVLWLNKGYSWTFMACSKLNF